MNDRELVKQTDEKFRNYINKYFGNDVLSRVNWIDLFFWEFRVGSWNGLVISGEQRISSDITIPYNNRILLEKLLSIPIEKRIKDIPHRDIMNLANPELKKINISVTNVKHTRRRAFLEKIYLSIHSKIPF